MSFRTPSKHDRTTAPAISAKAPFFSTPLEPWDLKNINTYYAYNAYAATLNSDMLRTDVKNFLAAKDLHHHLKILTPEDIEKLRAWYNAQEKGLPVSIPYQALEHIKLFFTYLETIKAYRNSLETIFKNSPWREFLPTEHKDAIINWLDGKITEIPWDSINAIKEKLQTASDPKNNLDAFIKAIEDNLYYGTERKNIFKETDIALLMAWWQTPITAATDNPDLNKLLNKFPYALKIKALFEKAGLPTFEYKLLAQCKKQELFFESVDDLILLEEKPESDDTSQLLTDGMRMGFYLQGKRIEPTGTDDYKLTLHREIRHAFSPPGPTDKEYTTEEEYLADAAYQAEFKFIDIYSQGFFKVILNMIYGMDATTAKQLVKEIHISRSPETTTPGGQTIPAKYEMVVNMRLKNVVSFKKDKSDSESPYEYDPVDIGMQLVFEEIVLPDGKRRFRFQSAFSAGEDGRIIKSLGDYIRTIPEHADEATLGHHLGHYLNQQKLLWAAIKKRTKLLNAMLAHFPTPRDDQEPLTQTLVRLVSLGHFVPLEFGFNLRRLDLDKRLSGIKELCGQFVFEVMKEFMYGKIDADSACSLLQNGAAFISFITKDKSRALQLANVLPLAWLQGDADIRPEQIDAFIEKVVELLGTDLKSQFVELCNHLHALLQPKYTERLAEKFRLLYLQGASGIGSATATKIYNAFKPVITYDIRFWLDAEKSPRTLDTGLSQLRHARPVLAERRALTNSLAFGADTAARTPMGISPSVSPVR